MEELENLRKSYLRHMTIGTIIAAIVTIGFVAVTKAFEFMFFIGIFSMVIVIFSGASKKKKYDDKYKKDIVTTTMQEIFTDVGFDYDNGFPSSIIRDTGMMRMGNTYSSNDWYSGKYKDVTFACSDVLIQEVTTDSEGHTDTTTYFSGQWYIFGFNKVFKGSFQVCEKGFNYSKHGGLFDKSIEKVEMEDVDFNKLFKVYSTDAHSVFYVLTPHTMESIKKLNDAIPGRLLFCFKDNLLHVAVYNGKDNFRPKVFSSMNLEEEKAKVRKEIEPITQLVEELRLDNSIFAEGAVNNTNVVNMSNNTVNNNQGVQ